MSLGIQSTLMNSALGVIVFFVRDFNLYTPWVESGLGVPSRFQKPQAKFR
jgi:hypothetical protein